jgi:hypothetical protein
MAEEAGRKADRTRSSYQEMTARGLMTFDELGAKLEELANTREVALQELEAIRDRRAGVTGLEQVRDDIVGTYVSSPSDVLESLEAEERHRIYHMLRLKVLAGADGSLTVSGISGATVFRTVGRDLRLDAS